MKKLLIGLTIAFFASCTRVFQIPQYPRPQLLEGKFTYNIYFHGKFRGKATFEVIRRDDGYVFSQTTASPLLKDSIYLETNQWLVPDRAFRSTMFTNNRSIMLTEVSYFQDSVKITRRRGKKSSNRTLHFKGRVFDYAELPYLLPYLYPRNAFFLIPEDGKIIDVKIDRFTDKDGAISIDVTSNKGHIEFNYVRKNGQIVLKSIYNADTKTLFNLDKDTMWR